MATLSAHRARGQARLTVRWGRMAAAMTGVSLALLGAAPTCGLAQDARFDAPAARALRVATAVAQSGAAVYAADGVIEAVRESHIAAQVAGRITEVLVRAGDRAQVGQILLRIDPSVASQQSRSSQAQLAQAQAILASARADLDRAKRLHDKQYLSDAAMEHAQTQFKAAEAQSHAVSAQAGAAGALADYYVLKAPYTGWVSRVEVSAGDLATPGRPLLTIYDPGALRVTMSVPESIVGRLDLAATVAIELPGSPATKPPLMGAHITVLPGLDSVTHSAIVRVDLPANSGAPLGAVPGQFARVRLPLRGATDGAAASVIRVPRAAVVERGELTGVYVVNAQGRAQLRQVRLGRAEGQDIEVLTGLDAGEHVALDPVLAAQASQR